MYEQFLSLSNASLLHIILCRRSGLGISLDFFNFNLKKLLGKSWNGIIQFMCESIFKTVSEFSEAEMKLSKVFESNIISSPLFDQIRKFHYNHWP